MISRIIGNSLGFDPCTSKIADFPNHFLWFVGIASCDELAGIAGMREMFCRVLPFLYEGLKGTPPKFSTLYKKGTDQCLAHARRDLVCGLTLVGGSKNVLRR